MTKWRRMRYMPCSPLGEDGKMITGCKAHIDYSYKAATEGMVLLKNEGLLPLKKDTTIALFGKAQFDYVKGGGGSGDVFCAYTRTPYDGFKLKESEGCLKVFNAVSEFYKDEAEKEKAEKKPAPSLYTEPELPAELVKKAADNADVAVISICRFSGEGWDRSSKKGDFYLSEAEEKMVNTITAAFDDVVVLLNVGGMIDTEWFKNSEKIKGALLMWNGGMEGGLAAADIICGNVNPSGKLTDTFAKTFEDYPSSESFNDSEMFVKYYEDIYVGYRYFETIPGKKDRVNYPFGFGLSYTRFEMGDINVNENEGKIYASVTVTNTGDVAGKEVVQLYYSAPQGKLGKSAVELGAFKKTEILNPGESQKIELSFNINDMASYDDTGKCEKSAYVLEGGEYAFYIGNSVRNTTKADYTYVVKEDFRVTEKLTPRMIPYNLEKRLCADGTFEDMPKNVRQKSEIVQADALNRKETRTVTFDEVADGKVSLDEFVAQLPQDYMAELLGGKPSYGVCNVGGIGPVSWQCGVDKLGVPCALTCDGPAGVRINPECEIPTTAFPCATLIACTWDTDIIEEIGRIGALEAKENNLMIWLTPALNIHRSPLCGRNFEYFSEDPLISGKMAAAMVRGIQSQNIAATPKHFACNNKETNRHDCDSIVSERAIREIYIKGFEICVKESSPRLLMTAYNPINSIRSCENYDMLTAILRGEWGYQGAVTTDWQTYGYQVNEIWAGNDIRMPQGYVEAVSRTMEWFDTSFVGCVQQSVKRVLQLLLDFE